MRLKYDSQSIHGDERYSKRWQTLMNYRIAAFPPNSRGSGALMQWRDNKMSVTKNRRMYYTPTGEYVPCPTTINR
jgi:hypothetical protein